MTEELLAMRNLLTTCLLMMALTGCAQPQIDQPRVNGAYLVIDGQQAWAVQVADGKRTQEQGLVVDVIKAGSQEASVAASYVIETKNCGRMQWLSERSDAADGITSLMLVHSQSGVNGSGCELGQSVSKVWTVLDYSS
ncbi:hypothetical protein WG219_10805 [Ectopseudomonas mendocina]|uniref:Lipoprotein n=1 Tax=Ectopseudomonas mendocina TaxID=300 RepID=A0ABZ2RLK6_ECTME